MAVCFPCAWCLSSKYGWDEQGCTLALGGGGVGLALLKVVWDDSAPLIIPYSLQIYCIYLYLHLLLPYLLYLCLCVPEEMHTAAEY